MSKNYLLFQYNVADTSVWKPIYDEREPKREQYGLKELQLLRNHASPNEITILFEAEDLAKAKAFSESEDLHKDLKRAGVLGVPKISILTSAA